MIPVEQVAEQLRAAFVAGPKESRRVLSGLYADEVEYRHVPALSSDGVVDGRRLGSSNDKEAAAIGGAISGQYYDGVTVSIDGDVIEVNVNMRGTLLNGVEACLPLCMRCRVTDGRIAAVTHVFTDGAMQAWAEVAVAGGLTSAAPLLES
jgi:hypothetical protein